MEFALIIQVLVGGVLEGGVYAIAALGLSLIYGVIGFLNLTHGAFIMIGGLIAFLLNQYLGLSPLFAIIPPIPVLFFTGLIFEKYLVEQVAQKGGKEMLQSAILITLGAILMVEDLTRTFVISRDFGISYYLRAINIAGITLVGTKLLLLVLIASIALILTFFLKKTYLGHAIRAIADNRESSKIVGINVSRVMMVTFGLGSALAALAGGFMVILGSMNPSSGLPLVAKLVTIIVLGGLGSLFGTFVGAIIIGVCESLVGFYIGMGWSPTITYLILIAILVVRPQGLFGGK